MSGILELVLIGRNIDRVRAEVNDYLDAAVLNFGPSAKLSYGGYSAVEGADIIVYTAGAGQKPGQDRLDLVKTNAQITRTIFTQIKPYIKN